MNPRVAEIIDRLDSIDLEEGKLRAEKIVLHTELREILDGTNRADDNPDFSMFKDTTRRLLTELWDAHNRMLSQEDIREDVIGDQYASDGAVKMAVKRARQEIENHRFFSYWIKSIPRRGYQLVERKKVTKSNMTSKNREK